MRKTKFRGFTLVELLAVIVILAVILIIAVPQIIKTIDSARIGAFKSTAKLLLTQAEKQHLANQTLNVNVGNLDDITYEGVGSSNTECGILAKLSEDYKKCKITVDGETGIATLVELEGNGKFANYVCKDAQLNGDNSVDVKCNRDDSNSSGSDSQSGSNSTVTVNNSFSGVVYTVKSSTNIPTNVNAGIIRLNEAYDNIVPAYTTPQAAMDAALEEVAEGSDPDGKARAFLKNTITNGIVTKIEIGFIIDEYLATEYGLQQGIYYLDPHNFEANYTLLNSLFTGEYNAMSETGGLCGVPSLNIFISKNGETLASVDDGGQGYLGHAASYHYCSYGNPLNDYGYVSSEDYDKYVGSCH